MKSQVVAASGSFVADDGYLFLAKLADGKVGLDVLSEVLPHMRAEVGGVVFQKLSSGRGAICGGFAFKQSDELEVLDEALPLLTPPRARFSATGILPP